MVDAESNFPACYVFSQQRTLMQKIKEQRPASDFRMLVAARVVLPEIAVFVGDPRNAQSAGKQPGAVHPLFLAVPANRGGGSGDR